MSVQGEVPLSRLGLETLRRGSGSPILVLHGVNTITAKAPFLESLAGQGEVIAPSHPGFGRSPRPDSFQTVYDLVHLYRSVLDTLPSGRVTLVGFSFGGWIAAEIAAGGHEKLERLILVDPVGIKVSGPEKRDIAHFFNTSPEELNRRAWHDSIQRPPGTYGLGWQASIDDTMSDAEMTVLARNWDALCEYSWRPHMYNPQLRNWLHRISVRTLVLWGESDQIVTPDYGQAYSNLIPGSRFETIAAAGHHPELEQPEQFAKRVAAFLGQQD